MKKILILGAGLSSSSLIKYLLENSIKHDWKVIVGDMCIDAAEKKIGGHENGSAIKFDIDNEAQKEKEIQNADVVISMLPASMHHLVANSCVKNKKHMLTASYVSPEMKSFDADAKEAGIAILNELGVDPGIDHMSAMKVINEIRETGGKLLSFSSSTGGLVAPEYDNNPWNYKFTWNPRNVVLAGQGVSKYKESGKVKYIPYHKLYSRLQKTSVLEYGEFEIYANRDSLGYIDTYNLGDIPTMFRGTMRRPGYCESWNVFVQLGATDNTYIIEDSEDITYKEFINTFLQYDEKAKVESKLASYLNIAEDSEIMNKLKWLGLFEDTKVGLKKATPAQILQKILVDKWSLDSEDKDMIAMQHQFIYTKDNQKKKITSSLVVFGKNTIETAMAITVGIPVAIATKLLLTGKINVTGVHVPVTKNLYEPILAELEEYGIKFIDEEEMID